MVYFRKILEAALSLCLIVDGRILKVVDQIGLLLGISRFPLNKGSGKSSLFKRWVIYSFLSALTVGVGVISCADSKLDTDIGGPVVQPTPKKPGKVLGFEIEPLDAQVKATWNDPVLEEGAEVSEYKISVYKVEGFKIAHLKTEMYPYQEGRREAIVGDLMNGQIYTFQIQASNAQGDSIPSEKIYSMPRPDGLGSLENLSSSAGDAVVTLTWNKIELANRYSVLRSLGEDGDDYKELYRGDIMCSTGSQCSFTDNEGLQNAKLYFYKVVAQMAIDDPRLQKHEIVESSAVTPTSNTPRTVTNTQVKVRLVRIDNTRSITDSASVTFSIEEPELVLGGAMVTAYRIETLPFSAADDSTNVEATQDIPRVAGATQASVGQPYAQDKKYRFKALSGSAGSYAEIPDTAAFLDISKISPSKPVIISFQAGRVTNVNIDLSWRSDMATHYTLKRGASDIFTKSPASQFTSEGGQLTYVYTHGLGYSASYFFTLVPHIILPGIEDIDGASLSINGFTPGEQSLVCEVDSRDLPGSTAPLDSGLERDIDDILTTFRTLQEKVKVLYFVVDGTKFQILYDIENLGLNDVGVGVVDGPAGVVSPSGSSAVSRATIFPAPLLMAASWDKKLMQKVGAAMGIETRHNNKRVLLAPGVNIYRIPHNGRNYEYYGEDPHLVSQTAVSFIKGIQSQDVVSTLKHYCCNNTEFDRWWSSSDMDDRTLHEIYLPAYRAGVREAGVWSLMNSFNPVQNTLATENELLIQDILKTHWNFNGFLMADWDAIRSPSALKAGTDLEMPRAHRFSFSNIQSEITAGRASLTHVDGAIRRIMRSMLASRALRYERAKKNLLIEGRTQANFEKHHNLALEAAQSGIVLLRNQENTLPLPKTGNKKILVIGNGGLIETTPRLATGSAHVRPDGNTFLTRNNIKDQMTDIGGTGVTLTFETFSGGNGQIDDLDQTSDTLTASQITAIQGSDYVIVVTGFGSDGEAGFNANGIEGEAKERAYPLPPGQDRLVELVAQTIAGITPAESRPKLVVTLTAGAGTRMSSEGWDDVDAIVHSFYLGESIKALPQVLFGDVNPSGKLPITIEAERKHSSTYNTYELNKGPTSRANKTIQQLITAAHSRAASGQTASSGTSSSYALEYGEGIFVGYRHFDRYQDFDTYFETSGKAKYYPKSAPIQNDDADSPTYSTSLTPLFAFGHGLSYSTFTYGSLSVKKGVVAPFCRDVLRFSLNINNTSSIDGTEIVQLYVRDKEWDSDYPRPYKELKGYTRVSVKANETKEAFIDIPADAFAYYRIPIGEKGSKALGKWTIDTGEFEILVASSSTDIRQRKTINVNSVTGEKISFTVDGGNIELANRLNSARLNQ